MKVPGRRPLRALLLIVAASAFLLSGIRHGAAATNLFIGGQGGYHTYRIPALYETSGGTLLAFCEGRKNSASDTGDIDTLLRRSLDGGVTWTPQVIVWSDGANTCGNPTVVQDKSTGRIWLFLTWNHGQDTQSAIQSGSSRDVRRIYSSFSDDDGATWSAPVNRSAEVQPATTRWDATGPGRGVQTLGGRLIIPANGRNIHSDDHGVSWSQSAWLPPGSSESQVVVLSHGALLRNDRATGENIQYNSRVFCRTSDQGASWGPLEIRADLPCPVCQGSTITVDHPGGVNGRVLVFSNPSSKTRDHLTLQFSLDEGVTWPLRHEVYSGSAAYSSLSAIGVARLGLLYERDNYQRIVFETFSLERLLPVVGTAIWNGAAGPGRESWQIPANWISNALPNFSSGLDVFFHEPAARNLTNAIGADCVIRSLHFTTDAISRISIHTSDRVNSPAAGRILTFDGAGRGATNLIPAGKASDLVIGDGPEGVGSITLADDLTVEHHGSGELRFGQPVSGPGGIIKNGRGRLFLRRNNSYTGNTVMNSGTLILGGDSGSLGAASGNGRLYFNGGVIANSSRLARPVYNHITVGGDISFGGVTGYENGWLTIAGVIDLGGVTRLLTVQSPVTITGAIQNGGLGKGGSGPLTLAGDNTYTGPTVIYAGLVQLGNGGDSGSLAPAASVAIGPNGIFQFNRANHMTTFANPISGLGVLLKTNLGEIALTGKNSFSGALSIQSGKLALASDGCVNGAPAVVIGADGTLSLGSAFLGKSAAIGTLEGAGRIDAACEPGAGIRILSINQKENREFAGAIQDATLGRVLGLIKSGEGDLLLAGTNTHTGPTTITAGRLEVKGAVSLSGITVKSGATLGGTGFLGGAATIENGGTLALPSSPGAFTIANQLSLASGSITTVEINAANGQSARLLGLTGVSYAGTLVVTNLASHGTLTAGQTFQIFGVVPSAVGNFEAITSPETPGAVWQFNPVLGRLSVVATTAPDPISVRCGESNGVLSLGWPRTHLGWILQTNALGLNQPEGWHNLPGSHAVTDLIIQPDAEGSSVFYRLIAP